MKSLFGIAKHAGALSSVAVCALISTAAAAQTAPRYITTQFLEGELIADQTNGAITVCIGNYTSSNMSPFVAPAGKCQLLGTITPSSTWPSLTISAPTDVNVGYSTFFVTNVYTGVVVQCAWKYNYNNNGIVTGQCASLGIMS
ncbi:MAG TPA: hypothetical protein VGG48_09030 [Rhizomicrobium sp.]